MSKPDEGYTTETDMRIITAVVAYAIDAICPITGDPHTEHEKRTVRMLHGFGWNLLCHLRSEGLITFTEPATDHPRLNFMIQEGYESE